MSEGRLRIDKWLWFARVAKTRTQAQKLAVSGHVRRNREKVTSASESVRPGDVLTIGLNNRVRVLKIVSLGDRRGPASEAQTLYEDMSPPPMPRIARPEPPAQRDAGAGRPTKRDRRQMDAFRADGDEND